MTARRRASRLFALLRVGIAFAIAHQTGCGSTAIRTGTVSVPLTESHVGDRIRKGERVFVRTNDGVRHNGHFIRFDMLADSTSLVMSEYEPRSGREPLVVAFNLARIDSISKEHSTPVPRPLMNTLGVAALVTVAAFVAIVVSFQGLGDLN